MNRLRSLVLVVVGLGMALVGSPFMFLLGKAQAEAVRRLRAEGKRTPATVLDVQQRSRKSDRVQFRFTAGRQTVDKWENASRETSDRAASRGALTVTYLPDDPNVATLDLPHMEANAGASTGWAPVFLAVLGLGTAFVGARRLRAG